MSDSKQQDRILVIKLSALGDFIQAIGPMAAIRRHHPDADITLLTTAAFKGFAEQTGHFNDIWLDERLKWHQPLKWIKFRKTLRSKGLTRVYDLQNNDRTCTYFKLFNKNTKPEWVGIAPGASHRNTSPDRTAGHAFDGHVQTLGLAGITDVEIDDLSWMDGDIKELNTKSPYILLVPGCAPTRPEKRWPAQHFTTAAHAILELGYQPVIIGTAAEENVTREIAENCPQALDLTGKTSLGQITALARAAAAAIGNDTGPMHLIGATGCPSLTLFSSHSDPIRHAPKGPNVAILQSQELKDLSPDDVIEALQPRDKTKQEQTTKAATLH